MVSWSFLLDHEALKQWSAGSPAIREITFDTQHGFSIRLPTVGMLQPEITFRLSLSLHVRRNPPPTTGSTFCRVHELGRCQRRYSIRSPHPPGIWVRFVAQLNLHYLKSFELPSSCFWAGLPPSENVSLHSTDLLSWDVKIYLRKLSFNPLSYILYSPGNTPRNDVRVNLT
jgi:hypothetical protein